MSDQLWVARWLLYRIAEDFGIAVTHLAEAGLGRLERCRCAHQLLDERRCGRATTPIITACEALGKRVDEHIEGYGDGIEQRLTGQHETAPYNVFNYGVSDRGASVRIPWQVEKDQKGYIEDRRPNANMDPYVVTRLIVDTCCSRAGVTNDQHSCEARAPLIPLEPASGLRRVWRRSPPIRAGARSPRVAVRTRTRPSPSRSHCVQR